METTKTLELKFKTANGKSKNLSLRNPRENLTAAEIQPAMDAIVGLGAFEVKGVNPYAAIDSARYVERTVTDIFDVAQ